MLTDRCEYDQCLGITGTLEGHHHEDRPVDQIAGAAELRAAACGEVFHEQVSSVGSRPEFERAPELGLELERADQSRRDRRARGAPHLRAE
jgi:hypothetical protein